MILDYPFAPQSRNDLRELRELVRHGENKHVEFKLKTNHPEKIIREIVAFANSDGGQLIIGVGDDRSIKGLKFADEDEFILRRAIERHIFPAIEYDVKRVELEGDRDVLIFNIPKSQAKPHYVDLDGIMENRRAYVRVEDRSVQASREMREILKGERKAQNIRFHYGDKERTLMRYLADNKHITVETYASIANIPRKIASRTLVVLVLANVIKVQPHEVQDYFMAA
ncbi:AlbA family DNA-binding domain-containing protein [Emticicia fluvialis]|uniref:AlbA family DNA-binding domain-containing protein n=1 Tax=Emticicia fluvialis TaxID=2974474 RepID=UPI002165E709|nr:ATP-binding protein [Emticicia fluvialis]